MPHPPTLIISIDPDNPDTAILDDAARHLRAGGLVAFAAETVYGLGADATNPEAVARVFQLKGRPALNPLIVHAGDAPMALRCVDAWPIEAERLAARFWPGPLTLVLPRSAIIPDLVTAGRETVGVRVPSTTVARELIRRAGVPVAAPSANRSSGLSPTLASHVAADLADPSVMILDSGQTPLGLESTVLDLTTREPRVLRPGPITAFDLEHALGGMRVRTAAGDTAAVDAAPKSPGQLPVHYAPRTPTHRVETPDTLARYPWPAPARAAVVALGPNVLPAIPVPEEMRFTLAEPGPAARDFYVVLHQCDSMGLERIVLVPPPDRPEWAALRDRIARASTAWQHP